MEEDEHGQPVAIVLGRGGSEVASIEDRWKVVDEWWRPEPVARMYYQVITDGGRRVTLYRDLVGGGWYRQQA